MPESRFHFKGIMASDPEYVQLVHNVFGKRGISADRILWTPFSHWPDLARFYQSIDLSLDTYPAGGGLTTLETLWMGIPVVTRYGRGVSSRSSRSILHCLGYPSWITATDEEYIQRACELAVDLDTLERRTRQPARRGWRGLPFATDRSLRGIWSSYLWRCWRLVDGPMLPSDPENRAGAALVISH